MSERARRAADNLCDMLPLAFIEGSPPHLAVVKAFAAFEAEIVERCAKIAVDLRKKHSEPIGDAYNCGVWDQSVRIAAAIRKGSDNEG